MHAVERATLSECDDGCAAGLSFYGDDAKIFDLGEYHKSGAAVERSKFIIADVAEEFGVRAGERFQTVGITACACDEQRFLSKFGSGDCKLNVLVALKRAGVEPEIFACDLWVVCEILSAYRRVNDS